MRGIMAAIVLMGSVCVSLADGTAVRVIDGSRVTVTITPDSTVTTAWAYEEYLPSQLSVNVLSATEEDVVTYHNGKISAVITGATKSKQPFSFTYRVSGADGVYAITNGMFSYNPGPVQVPTEGPAQIALPNWQDQRDTSWTGGAVANAAQLAQLAYLVNNGTSFVGQTVTLGANISLAGRQWTPIGIVLEGADADPDWTLAFHGTFDGNGKVIDGLTISNSTELAQGLFGAAATVRDLTLTNVAITVTEDCVMPDDFNGIGSIAGVGLGCISNCTAYGSIIYLYQELDTEKDVHSMIGGIVGFSAGVEASVQGVVAACSSYVALSGVGFNMGGVGGYNDMDSRIVNCANFGGIQSEGVFIGGVVSMNDGSVLNSFNQGELALAGYNGGSVGGVVAYNYEGVVRNVYCSGAMNSQSSSLGGVVGTDDGGVLVGCYWLGGTSAAAVGYEWADNPAQEDLDSFTAAPSPLLSQSGGKLLYALNDRVAADGGQGLLWWAAAGSPGGYPVLTPTAPSKITVSFAANGGAFAGGGSASNATCYADDTYGERLALSNLLSRTGYTFKEWYTAASGGTEVLSADTVAAGTVYAQWTANAYIATFDAAGGTPATTNIAQTYDGNTVLPAPDPVRTGYTFVGWTNSIGATVTASTKYQTADDTTFSAEWTAMTYTVTYVGNGQTGGSTAASTHTYDVQKALTANGFTKTGYLFVGWTNAVSGGALYADGASVLNLAAAQGATVSLTAVWIAGTSNVTLDPNSGNGGTANVTATYGQAMPAATAPERTGYAFAGYWDTSAATGGTQYYDAAMDSTRGWDKTGAQTLWARWAANRYTATFDAGVGTPAQQTVEQTYDAAYVLPSTMPTRPGYAFAGWFTTQNGGGTQVSSAVTFQNDGAVTLYAKWTANAFSVRFNRNNAAATGAMTDEPFVYDQPQALTANAFLCAGQRVTGWGAAAGGPVVYADGATVSNLTAAAGGVVDLYAQWVDDTVATFDAQGGSAPVPASVVVTNGLPYGPLAVTARDGYTFGGWFTQTNGLGDRIESSTIVLETHSRTLYAKWTANTYTATFWHNNGTQDSEAIGQTYDAAYILPSITPTPQTGYYFTGWWTAMSGGGEITSDSVVKITEDTAFYGHWTNLYMVVFDAQGGAVSPSNKVVNYGAPYGELPSPSRDGYGFDGWWTAVGGSGDRILAESTVSITATQTLYAAWTNLPVTVTFDPGAGTVDPATAVVLYDLPYGALPVPTRTGYTFTNWLWTTEGVLYAVTNATVVPVWTNHVLVAGWSNNVYTLTFDPDGGTVSPTSKQIVYDLPYGELPRPRMTGFASRGWTNSLGETITAQMVVSVTNDFTVYPKWEVSYEVNVILDPQGGAVSPTNIVYETGDQTAYTGLPVPEREDFLFAGWYASWTNNAQLVTNGTEFLSWDEHSLYARWVGEYSPAEGTLGVVTNTDGTAALQYTTNHVSGALTLDRVPNTADGAPVVTIGASGFFQQAGVTDLHLGIFVTNVGARAFAYCSALTNVFLQRPVNYLTGAPDTLTVGNGAFMYCTKLRQVVFPSGLVRIGIQAFDGCVNLTRLYFEGGVADPTTLIASANAFRGVAQANGGTLEIYYRDVSISNAFATIQTTLLAGGVTLGYHALGADDDVYELAAAGIATLPLPVQSGMQMLSMASMAIPTRQVEVRFVARNTFGKTPAQVMANILAKRQVTVLYWTRLDGKAEELAPLQTTDNGDGSATVIVEVPEGESSGFFKVTVE